MARELRGLLEQAVHKVGGVAQLLCCGVVGGRLALGEGKGVDRLAATLLTAFGHHGEQSVDAEGEPLTIVDDGFYQAFCR